MTTPFAISANAQHRDFSKAREAVTYDDNYAGETITMIIIMMTIAIRIMMTLAIRVELDRARCVDWRGWRRCPGRPVGRRTEGRVDRRRAPKVSTQFYLKAST
jgi:hypothetical protein